MNQMPLGQVEIRSYFGSLVSNALDIMYIFWNNGTSTGHTSQMYSNTFERAVRFLSHNLPFVLCDPPFIKWPFLLHSPAVIRAYAILSSNSTIRGMNADLTWWMVVASRPVYDVSTLPESGAECLSHIAHLGAYQINDQTMPLFRRYDDSDYYWYGTLTDSQLYLDYDTCRFPAFLASGLLVASHDQYIGLTADPSFALIYGLPSTNISSSTLVYL